MEQTGHLPNTPAFPQEPGSDPPAHLKSFSTPLRSDTYTTSSFNL